MRYARYRDGFLRVEFTVDNIGSAPSAPSTLRLYIDGSGHGHETDSLYEGYDYEMAPLAWAFPIPLIRSGDRYIDEWNVPMTEVGDATLIAMIHNCQWNADGTCSLNELKWINQQEGDMCAGANGFDKYASNWRGGDDWRNKEHLADCENVEFYQQVALAPTPTPRPTPTPTPTPRPTRTPSATPTPTPTSIPPSDGRVVVTMSWNMFPGDEPIGAWYNVGLCDPSDCAENWLYDDSGPIYLTWHDDDGSMSIPLPPGRYKAKVEAYHSNVTDRCTVEFEITSGFAVRTLWQPCDKSDGRPEFRVW